ncbi:disulfide bond formation protein DsbA [Pseudonocardia sp. CA-107938]|uniref:mycothiol-dependent nitroreductase Rv2466c family protein n=1 Tax=Pseudonocardia sp. CA-107938 TaxID=3240021 RepID=UPI003D8E1429
MADRWTADLWSDPACPLSRLTARWLGVVAEARPIDVEWRVMSLKVLNEHLDVDPEGDDEGYLWIPARIATAVRTRFGSAALGRFHDALWTDGEWIGDPADALARCGLPAELAAAGWSTEYDAALRASHAAATALVGPGVGTPILAVTGPDGVRGAVFGPVLTGVPDAAEALRLWDGIVLLAQVPQLRELKR